MKLKSMMVAVGLATAAFVSPAFAAETPVTDTEGLAAAVEAASDNDVLVLSANTTYTLTDQLVITNAITIRGAGIDSSIIKQTTKEKRVIVIDNSGARVEGCTITGANVSTEINNVGVAACDGHPWGIAVTLAENGGTLYNCRVTGNKQDGSPNKNKCVGVYVMSADGLVSHCRIDNNTVKWGTTETYGGLRMLGGTAEYCLVANNKGHQTGGLGLSGPCTVNNCTFYANEATQKPGGNLYVETDDAVLNDCIFTAGICPGTQSGYGVPEWGAPNYQKKATFNRCSFPIGVSLAITWRGSAFNADPAFVDLVDFQTRLTEPRTADIGWNPVDSTDGACDFSPSPVSPLQGHDVTLTSSIRNIADPVYSWTITDPDGNETVKMGETSIFTAEKLGTYTVALSVSGVDAPVVTSIPVVAANVYPTTGAELLSAVNATADGQEIILDEQTYEITAPLVLSSAATITGKGRDKTFIVQKTKSNRVVDMNCANAVVEGVTLKGTEMGAENIHGCVVRIQAKGGTVKNCTITGAYCPQNWTYGIGIAMYGGTLTHSIVSNNTINATARNGDYGGGVYISKGTVSNTLVCDNTAQQGCGVYVDGTAVRIENCTIVKNTMVSTGSYVRTGGGLYVAQAATFVNDIIALNDSTASSATASTKEFDASVDATFTSCLFASGVSNTHIKGTPVFADPIFENADARNFTEKGSSPSVNTGTDYAGLAEKDLAGFKRKSGSAVDIGCYEFDSDEMTVSFSQSSECGFPSVAVSFAAVVSGIAEGAPVSCLWTVTNPDGVAEVQTETGTTLTLQPTAYGHYTVAVTATSGSATSPEYKKPDCYYVAPHTMYVAEATDESSARSVFPYVTAETAATNVLDAVNSAIDGTEVVLLAGEHRVSTRVDIAKALTIRGQGWETTTLRQTATETSIVLVNNPLAVVRGLTITGLYSEKEIDSSSIRSGAVVIDSQGGVVEDCRITGNRYKVVADPKAGINQACGVGITLNGEAAVCRRCVIDRNQGANGINNDRGGGVQGIAGLLENCLVCMNTNKHAGGIFVNGPFTIRNCTVVGNVGTDADSDYGVYGVGGLGVGGSKNGSTALSNGKVLVENCIFAANESPNQEWTDGGYPDCRVSAGNVTFSNCLMAAGIDWPSKALSVTDCLNGDPRFADPSSGNFRLKLRSPARNAGSDRTVPEGETDLDGAPRLFGRRIDMGCYELQKGLGTQIIVR